MTMLQGILNNLPDAIGLGLVWGVMAIGVFITFRVLDFADMTVDGSFAMGGCISGGLIVGGMNPLLSLFVAILGGMAAGLVTGILHTKLKIPGILAGILTMFGLYSVNLRILGRPNVGLLNQNTIFDQLKNLVNVQIWDRLAATGLGKNAVFNSIKNALYLDNRKTAIAVGLIVVLIVVFALYWFFGTELGSSLRATGCNEYMVRALGVSTDTMKIMGLVIANTLVALSGAVYTQYQYYSDVNMGQGAIVIGLASIVIGEVLFGHRANFFLRLVSVVGGSIIYRIAYVVVLKLGMKSEDMKLLTAVVVALALSVPVIRGKIMGFFKKRRNNAAYGVKEKFFTRKRVVYLIAAAFAVTALVTSNIFAAAFKCSVCGANISGEYRVSPETGDPVCLDCSKKIFDDNMNFRGGLTRGMFIQMMYIDAGEPEVSTVSGFKDVPDGAYYADAVNWAAENNITDDRTPDAFNPDDPITREQLAAMVDRYEKRNENAVPEDYTYKNTGLEKDSYKSWLVHITEKVSYFKRNVVLAVEALIFGLAALAVALIRPGKRKEAR